MGIKSYEHRGHVKKFLPYWKRYLKSNGKEETKRTLKNGKTLALTRKDQLGLLQALGLDDRKVTL